MDPSTAARLESLRPAIKREWEKLLRMEPALSPMANPDTLVFLMDATLSQVRDGLQARSTKGWLHRSAPVVAPLQRRCACGLNPLLKYYATGELAIRATAGAQLRDTSLEEALLFFRALAHQDIDTLCDMCQHQHGPACDRAAALTSSSR